MESQKGISLIKLLFLIGVVVFLGILGMTLAPPYMEHLTVKKSLESLAKEPDVKTLSTFQIKELLLRRFQVNNVKNVDAKSLEISKKNGKMTLSMNYEVRVHVMGNVDAVLKFDEAVLVE